MSDEEIGDFLRRYHRLHVLSLPHGGKLDIKGTRLHQMPPQMDKLSKLQTLTDFFMGIQNGSSIKELGELKCLEGKLRIWMLQNIDDAQDALGANLEGMKDLKKLDLRWSDDAYDSIDEHLIHQLKRHVVSFYGDYTSTSIPFKSPESLTFERMLQWCEWILDAAKSDQDMSFPCLQVLCISECPKLKVDLRLSGHHCFSLPPLDQLACLKRLQIKAFDKVELCEWIPDAAKSDQDRRFPCLQVLCISECPKLKIVSFYGDYTSTSIPFKSPESLTFERMLQWCELIPDAAKSDQDRSFPCLQVLCISECPKLKVDLRFSGHHCFSLPPLDQLACLKRLQIKAFDKVERVGCEFYRDCISTSIPFKSPESLTFERMLQWCEWIPDAAKSDQDRSFPCLQVLCISECPKLKVDCSLLSLVTLKNSCCGELESFPALGSHHIPECVSSKLKSLVIHDCQKLFAYLEELDLEGFSLTCCELRGISSSTTTLLPIDSSWQLRFGYHVCLRLKGAAIFLSQKITGAIVPKTWIEDAKEAIYEVEDLLIDIDNEARQIELEANFKTGMDQSKEDMKKLLLSDDAEGESLQTSKEQDYTKCWLKWVNYLNSLTDFSLGTQNGSSIKELGELKCLEGKLRIWMLQNIDDAQDALGANLEGMTDLKKLDLRWSDDAYVSIDEHVIHQLKPHVNVCCLVTVGYGGSRFPTCLINSCLVDLRLSGCHCFSLPPLGQLACLKGLQIKAFDKIERVEHFPKLKQLDISGCSHLESLYLSDGSYTSTSPLKLCEWSNLEDVSLFDYSYLKSVDCSLPSLVTLKNSCCGELESFPALGSHHIPECVSSKLKSLAIHDCQKLFARLEELDLEGFSLTFCELRGISSSTTTHLPIDSSWQLRFGYHVHLRLKGAAVFLGQKITGAIVPKTWIEDAKEAIYEVEDLLIDIDNEARQIELEANFKTGMDQSKEDMKKLLLSDDAEGESLQTSKEQDYTKCWLKWVNYLNSLTDFSLGTQNGSSIKELGELKCLEGKLRIWMLQNIDDAQDALGANLEGMTDLKKLDLRWSDDAYVSIDEHVIHQLKPHVNVCCLVTVGYGGSRFPTCLINSCLVDLRLSGCHCFSLPPLSQLACLKGLQIKAFDKIERVEHFPKLKQLDISGCSHLESLYLSDGSYTSTSPLKLCEWSNLEDVSLFDYSYLKSVDCSLPSLVTLKNSCCGELESFPALGSHHIPECVSSKLKSLAIHDCQKLFARLEELDLEGFSLTFCELRGISSSTTTHLPIDSSWQLRFGYHVHLRLKGAAVFLGQKITGAIVPKTWIEDAKEAIYEVEDLLIDIDNEARQIELEANFKTGMDQSKEDMKKLLLSDDAEGESLQHKGVRRAQMSRGKLRIWMLENIHDAQDALGANLEGMTDLKKLDLRWNNDAYVSIDEHIKAFDKVERVGCEFNGDCTSTSIPFKSPESLTFKRMLQWCEWIPDGAKSDHERSFPCLQVLCMSECPKLKVDLRRSGCHCFSLPRLGQMACRKRLQIKAFNKVERVGCEFNGDCTSTSIPFKSPESLSFERMLQCECPKLKVDLRLSGCHCFSLSPLGHMACLKRLQIKAFDKVQPVGCEFYGDCTSTSIPFKSPESLTFERMLQWCEWILDAAKSDQDMSFPCLQVLCISECPKLKVDLRLSGHHCFSLPPLDQLACLKRLHIKAFDKVELVGCEFYGDCTSTSIPFKSPESLTFERMLQCECPKLKVDLRLSRCHCLSLPPIGQLTCLKRLHIKAFDKVERVGYEFYRDYTSTSFPFKSLESLTCERMLQWCEWIPDAAKSDQDRSFPSLQVLCISECPKLKGTLLSHLRSLKAHDYRIFLVCAFTPKAYNYQQNVFKGISNDHPDHIVKLDD
ncbi:hypothetical protein DKX38_027490 [Salix brachista]|uniref:R13L1/DRL21-like LRR repeat region domain-containing protein n=1 Tax=Salix brachista TaxID=2182728 RepID=A0A5N5JCZ5_9ROSI|nr:hypothetical protein DKX38_027490 [Salix brachista]